MSARAARLVGPAPSITSDTAEQPDISPTSWLKQPIVTPRSTAIWPSSGCSWPVIIRKSAGLARPVRTDEADLLSFPERRGGIDEEDLVGLAANPFGAQRGLILMIRRVLARQLPARTVAPRPNRFDARGAGQRCGSPTKLMRPSRSNAAPVKQCECSSTLGAT
jgi:hypothetical protein